MDTSQPHALSASDEPTRLSEDSRQDSFAHQFRRETQTLTPRLRSGAIWAEKYRILRLLGQGGMGDVYEAAHVHAPDLRFAVKILRASAPGGLARQVLREATSIARVRHRHVVAVTDLGFAGDDVPYLVMEFVGVDLQEYARLRGGVLPARDAVEFCAQICDALVAAHSQGIVHRDIKPRNCLVHRELNTEYIVVSDFGLARSLDREDSPISEWTIAGSRGYMAPEVLLGHPRPDHRVDIYSVGATLFCLLTGSPPPSAMPEKASLSRNAIAKAVPRALLPILLRTLAFKPDRRYHSAQELGAALRESLLALVDPTPSARRNWLPFFAASGGILASLVLVLSVLTRAEEHPPRTEPERVEAPEPLHEPAVYPSSLEVPRPTDTQTISAVAPTVPPISKARSRGMSKRPADTKSPAEPSITAPCEHLRGSCRLGARTGDSKVITLVNHGTGLSVEDMQPLKDDRTLQDCVTRALKHLCRSSKSPSECRAVGDSTCKL